MTTQTLSQNYPSESLKLRKYTLTVRNGPNKGLQRQLDRRLIFIGNSPDVAFSLDDATVSKHHLRIEADRTGFRVRDLDSKNGTWLNGVRICDAYLGEESVLKLGNTEIVFNQDADIVEIELSKSNRLGRMLGQSMQMREIFALLCKVAPTNYTVLVEGESGTGKELAAEAVHGVSRRNAKPFIVFDCSAVASDLIESELFGHVKGAFTGATQSRVGAFEAASGGTLFLDEIGELSLELQPKLLRVLEQRQIKPVGSNQMRPVDVRIVAATNRNLQKEVEAGNFREDLYYRLAVFKVTLPPLRNRVEDIPLLVNHFLESIQADLEHSEPVQISYDTMEKLQRHQWPGNIRELKNFVERAALLADSGRVETKFIGNMSLKRADAGTTASPPSIVDGQALGSLTVDYNLPFKDAKSRLIEHFEQTYWKRLLKRNNGNISQTAREAGIHRKSLEYLLKKLDIRAVKNLEK